MPDTNATKTGLKATLAAQETEIAALKAEIAQLQEETLVRAQGAYALELKLQGTAAVVQEAQDVIDQLTARVTSDGAIFTAVTEELAEEAEALFKQLLFA